MASLLRRSPLPLGLRPPGGQLWPASRGGIPYQLPDPVERVIGLPQTPSNNGRRWRSGSPGSTHPVPKTISASATRWIKKTLGPNADQGSLVSTLPKEFNNRSVIPLRQRRSKGQKGTVPFYHTVHPKNLNILKPRPQKPQSQKRSAAHLLASHTRLSGNMINRGLRL